MLNTLKSELRKLYALRSTYVVLLVCIGFTALFAFYGTGYRSSSGDLRNPGLLASQAVDAIQFLGVIGSLVAVLLVTHEYRYNLINYTLTAARTRSQVVLAKIIAITTYAVLFSAFFGVLSPLLAYAGLHAHGVQYAPQTIPYGQLAWHILLAGWAYFMLAFSIAMLIRHQVGALVTAFVFPGVISQLLTLVFRGNDKYLPYQALSNVLSAYSMSRGKAAIVLAIYVVVGWLIAWLAFLRRDAS